MSDLRHPTLSRRAADEAVLVLLKTVRWLLMPWPMAWRIRFGGWAGWLAGRLSKRRSLARNNLKRAFGSESRSTRANFESIIDQSYRDLGRSLVEFLMSGSIDSAYFESHVEFEGWERFAAVTGEGKGAVLLTAHFGNWEFLNLMAGVKHFPLAVLAKRQKLIKTDAWLNRLRAQRGARVVLRGMEVRQVYKVLENGGLAGILADQDGGSDGVFVPLFGRQSSYPRGVARFTCVTGAPALPVFSARVSADRHRICMGRPVHRRPQESETDFEQRVVREFSSQLEAMVRRYPSQWLWAHRRWKSSPDRDLLVLDDGRKGHVHQSAALAKKIEELRSSAAAATHVRTLRVAYRSNARRAALTVYGILTRGRLWGGMAWLKWALTPDAYRAVSTTPADILISCGTATEAANLIVSRDCRARSCYIQKPQFGKKFFSAVLAPSHDRLASAGNMLKTSGALSFVHPERLSRLRGRARTEAGIASGARAAALLVGGPSKHTDWKPEALEKIFFALREFSRENKLYLLVTTSRRTDAAVESMVERLFTGEPYCPVIVIPTRSNPASAYEGILASADYVLVTTDSVSMVSEAAATGKPVGLIAPGSADRPGKLGRFLAHLEREGTAVRVDAANLKNFFSRQPAEIPSGGSADAVGRAAELLTS